MGFAAIDSKDNMVYNFKAEFQQDEWNAILNEINLKMFYSLKDIYGCPDCVYGGAEWISIKEGSTAHKVTFDYGSEVKGIEKLILLLRNQRISLSKKYLKSN